MATYNLGKVCLTPKGTYSPSATYEALDIVTYSGSSYLVLQEVQGVTPVAGEYYMLIAAKGGKGDTGQAATVSVGTVTSLPAGSTPTVENVGTDNDAVLNFGLVQGNDGNVTSVDGVLGSEGNVELNAVRYTEQTLSDEQKAQIVENVGLVSSVNGNTGAVTINANNLGVGNKNLLENWHFTVNQRGITSGTTTYNKYNLDRWKWDYTGGAGTFSSGDRSLTVTPSAEGNLVVLVQPIEKPTLLNGKVLTASILLYNGNSYSGTITRVNGTTQYFFTGDSNVDKVGMSFGTSNDIRVFIGTQKTIYAVKLEFGGVSTLINDPDPDYATELLKCQRFFVRKTIEGNGFLTSSGNNRYWSFDLPIQMRTTPSVSLSGKVVVRGVSGYDNSFPLGGGTPTSMTIVMLKGGSYHVGFIAEQSNLLNNTPISFGHSDSTNGIVDLTADL